MLARVTRQVARPFSMFASIPAAPADPIIGLSEAYNKDTFAQKVNLGVGAYRDNEGNPVVLSAVRAAEKRILDKKMNHEYPGMQGVMDYLEVALKFAYGADSVPLEENRVSSLQTISGSGACRVAAEFMHEFGNGAPIYFPNPTWGNHGAIFGAGQMKMESYTYYNPETCGLDFEGMITSLKEIPAGSFILLHACAHNPTGVDPTPEQWDEISEVIKQQGVRPFFDCAYQGFASGDAEKDAYSIRKFVEDGHNIMLSQSFSKNFGLYGQRAGALSVVCEDEKEQAAVTSQLKRLGRAMYSMPPVHGARIVSEVLHDDRLTRKFYEECKEMADRIIDMRSLLRKNLEEINPRNWQHITDQIGMFAFTGLDKEQCAELVNDKHVYLTANGRISMAGINSNNVEYVAKSINDVCRD
eukprot:TRINITY_DN774000_c0_g1_i1.p1 TRINITY_DN774000_c0_g1~~TRINITY_DN774000_c0_g1_i1.p1  ORF type:complete len:413 (+),score=113.74 TRINITY_DN774000_c0_g1_i1:42-1280(+)